MVRRGEEKRRGKREKRGRRLEQGRGRMWRCEHRWRENSLGKEKGTTWLHAGRVVSRGGTLGAGSTAQRAGIESGSYPGHEEA